MDPSPALSPLVALVHPTSGPSMPAPLESPAASTDVLDESLVGRVLAGERACFELLMRRNNARLYRALRSVVRDEDQVEELMQQTYVLAFSKLSQFSGGARFSTWLLRIGLNQALQTLRHERRWPRAAPEALEEGSAMGQMSGASPEDRLAHAQLNHLLEQLVDELPESHRSVFVLREVQQLSTAEVSEVLSLTPDNVKQRLSRARALLRAALEQRTGESVAELYPFHAPRCDRVVAGVLGQLADGS